MTDRSTTEAVRNPLSTLPAAARIAALPVEAREALEELLRDISADARTRAEKCWRSHKAPMAAYWKALAVYSRHAAILITKVART